MPDLRADADRRRVSNAPTRPFPLSLPIDLERRTRALALRLAAAERRAGVPAADRLNPIGDFESVLLAALARGLAAWEDEDDLVADENGRTRPRTADAPAHARPISAAITPGPSLGVSRAGAPPPASAYAWRYCALALVIAVAILLLP